MRKQKRNHYAKFAIMVWYPWPHFDTRHSMVYTKLFDFKKVK